MYHIYTHPSFDLPTFSSDSLELTIAEYNKQFDYDSQEFFSACIVDDNDTVLYTIPEPLDPLFYYEQEDNSDYPF